MSEDVTEQMRPFDWARLPEGTWEPLPMGIDPEGREADHRAKRWVRVSHQRAKNVYVVELPNWLLGLLAALATVVTGMIVLVGCVFIAAVLPWVWAW